MMLRRPSKVRQSKRHCVKPPVALPRSPVPKHAVPRALGRAFRASWCRESGLPAGTRRRRHAPAGIADKTGDRCVPVRLTASSTVSNTSTQVSRPVTARILCTAPCGPASANCRPRDLVSLQCRTSTVRQAESMKARPVRSAMLRGRVCRLRSLKYACKADEPQISSSPRSPRPWPGTGYPAKSSRTMASSSPAGSPGRGPARCCSSGSAARTGSPPG